MRFSALEIRENAVNLKGTRLIYGSVFIEMLNFARIFVEKKVPLSKNDENVGKKVINLV